MPEQIVLESYVSPGAPLPAVRIRVTRPLGQSYAFGEEVAAENATVYLRSGETGYDYQMRAPGIYESVEDYQVQAGEELALEVTWKEHYVEARTHVPPVLALESVEVAPGEQPVSGLVLDSLFIDPLQVDRFQLDTLRTGASQGYIYLVEVTVHWRADYDDDGLEYWVRTQLRPEDFSRTRLEDYFLSPEQLVKERLVPRDDEGLCEWIGVYAVPVEAADDLLPTHRLRVALVRSTQAYAQFVSGSNSPKYREPPSNVDGALGIFAGVSVDSITVVVM